MTDDLTHTLIATVTTGIFVLDGAGRITFMNSAAEAMTGITLADAVGQVLHDLVHHTHPDGRPFPMAACAIGGHVLRGQPLRSHTDVFVRKDGSFFPVRCAATPMLSAGTVTGIVLEVQDLTAHQQQDEALRRQIALTQTVLENATACMFMMDARGYCTYMNRAGEAMFGWTFDEIRQQPLHAMIHHHHPDGRPYPMADCPIDRALPEHFDIREHEDVFIRRSGAFFPVLVAASPIFDATGRPVSTVIEVRDITERKRVEAAILRQSEQLRQLTQIAVQVNAARTIPDVLQIVTDAARELIGAHQAVASTTTDQLTQAISAVSLSERYTAWPAYDTTPDGSGLSALVSRTNQPLRLTQAELEAHPAWRGFGAQAAHHPPMRGWLAVPLVGLDGRNIGLLQLSDKHAGEFTADDEALLVQLAHVVAIAIENQHLYAQEQQARAEAEEASRLRDEFLAMLSHELRTPITSFLGYAQLLRRRTTDAAYVARTVEKMVRSAETQAQLIEDLLDVSRIVTGRLTITLAPLDLRGVIRAALDTVRPTLEAKTLQVQLDLDPAAGMVLGDDGRLQQVAWNLLANAVKFTPPGGVVAVQLKAEEQDVALTVRDTGEGISADFLPYVFDRFRQAESTSQRTHGGLGLGLAIVRHLVEVHGGTVQAASAGPGQGAAFTVRLPRATGSGTMHDQAVAAVPEETSDDHGCPEALHGLRVVVVDDHHEILELLQEILAPCGAVVHLCTTASEALAAVRTWQPDVLVADIAMPREDGYWLIGAVRALSAAEGGRVPAIALTAAPREDRLRLLAAGYQQYVPKPVDPDELRQVIARLADFTAD